MPVLGFCSYRPITRYSQSRSWSIKCPINGASLQITASSEFPKRRPRKSSSSRAKGSGTTSKRFIPKAPVGTGTHKRNTNDDDGENSVTPPNVVRERAPEIGVDSEGKQEIVLTNGIKVEGQRFNETNGKVFEISTANEKLVGDGRSRLKQNGSVQESPSLAASTENEISLIGSENDEKGLVTLVDDDIISLVPVVNEQMSLVASGHVQNNIITASNEEENLTALTFDDEMKSLVLLDDEMKIQILDTDEEDSSHKLKFVMEQERHRQVIVELAETNFSAQNNLFTYPQVVKHSTGVEVFFNRSLSVLKDEPDVLIMGAFNDWGWKSFTVKLDKSNLNGDWWTCKIQVPKEAYNIDFMFFNGKNVYDNNNRKDFHIDVVEGMDAAAFEDFLLEEKRRELEELAKEQAEKERRAEAEARTRREGCN